jgi:hypothetical protein
MHTQNTALTFICKVGTKEFQTEYIQWKIIQSVCHGDVMGGSLLLLFDLPLPFSLTSVPILNTKSEHITTSEPTSTQSARCHIQKQEK